MSWKQSLDRYLTSEPEDYFTPYCDEIIEKYISDDFYKNYYEDSVLMNSDIEDRWLSKLFRKGYTPEEAAKIFERAFILHVNSFKRCMAVLL